MKTLNYLLTSLFILCMTLSGFSQLSGSYLVGSEEDYESLSEIIFDLEVDGIDGPLLIEILPGTYDEQVLIPYIDGVSESNIITITSSTYDSADVILTAAPTDDGEYNEFNYVIALDASEYIHLENLTIKNTSSYFGSAIVMRNNAKFNKINSVHMYRLPESISNARYALLRTNDQAHNNTIENSSFVGGSYGWYGYGEDDVLDSMNYITNCQFLKQSFTAISSKNQRRFSATNNSIIAGDVFSIYRGIVIDEASDRFLLNNNKIAINHIEGGHGIVAYYSSEGDEASQITNNFISIYSEDNNTQTGIFITSSSKINIYHNSVYLRGSSPFAKCIRVTGSSALPSNDVEVKNNILINTAYRLCLEYDNHTTVNSDYNWLYTNGTYFGEWLNQDITSFANWKSYSGQDAHSVYMPPALVQFQNDTDLYVMNDTLAYFGDSLEVLVDVDFNSRDVSNPKVGAHEYTYVEGEVVEPNNPELLCTNNSMEDLWWADLNAYGSLGEKIIVLDNNNFLMTGTRESGGFIMDSSLTNPGEKTAFLAEWSLDSQLVKLYENSFDGAFTNIAQASNGDIIVEGYVYGEFEFAGETLPESEYYNYFLAAFDSSGNELWCKIREINSVSLRIQYFALAPNGDYAWISNFQEEVSENGESYTGEGSSNLFVQVYNSDGEPQWNKVMEGHFHMMEQVMAFDSNSELIIAGRMSDWTEIDGEVFLCDNDVYLWRFDQSGQLTDSRTFGGQAIEYPTAIEIDDQDNIIVAGFFNWGDFVVETDVHVFQGELDVFTVKFDSNFDYKWSWHYGTAYPEEINAMALDPQGNVLIGGKYAEGIGFSYTYNMNMTKLNGYSGEELWTRNYGHDDEDEMIYSLAINANGDILSSGRYESTLTFDGFFYALSDDTRRTALMHYNDDNPYPEVVIENETCPGLENGSIAFLNADESWQIDWDNGESGALIDSLSVGIYQVEIENAESCNFHGIYSITNPELIGILAEESSFCQGDSIWLQAGTIGEYYYWNSGDTTSGIWVKNEGWVNLTLQVGECSLYDSLDIESINPPQWPNTFVDSTLCFDPLVIDLDDGYSYTWNDEYEGGSRELASSGIYQVEASIASCIFDSEAFQISYVNPPSFNLLSDASFCEGAEWEVEAPAEFVSYVFNGGELPDILEESGYLKQIYFDTSLCYSESDSVYIELNPLPIFSFEDSYTVNKPNVLEIDGPMEMQTYNWIPEIGSGHQGFIESENWDLGEYLIILEVMDENGCAFTDSTVVIVDVNLALNEFEESINIYPNPSSSEVNISSKMKIDRLEIYDLNGSLVFVIDPNSKQFQIPLNELAKGIYKVIFSHEDMQHIERLIKL